VTKFNKYGRVQNMNVQAKSCRVEKKSAADLAAPRSGQNVCGSQKIPVVK
jgi:hypothetical protein